MHDFSSSKPLFGAYATLLSPPAIAIVNRSLSMKYQFIDNEYFQELALDKVFAIEDINEHTIRELLYNSHMSAILSMIRNIRWINSCWNEYESENILAWANNMRAFIESIADSHFDMFLLSFALAENKNSFLAALNGLASDRIFNIEKIEEKIIHFFQARKLSPTEKLILPKEYNAKQTWDYIKSLEKSGLPGLYNLYSKLSEIAHPSAHSINPFFRKDEEGRWVVTNSQDKFLMKEIISNNSDIFERILAYAFLSNFYMLRVLVKFRIFPLHPELKKFDFSPFPQWNELKRLIDL